MLSILNYFSFFFLFLVCWAQPDKHEAIIQSSRIEHWIDHLQKYDRLIFNLNKDSLVGELKAVSSWAPETASIEKKSIEDSLNLKASINLPQEARLTNNNSTTPQYVFSNFTLNFSNHSNDFSNSYEVKWYIKTLLSLIYGLISVLSVFGNGLIIWAVRRNKRMHNVTNYFISNLAMADVVIGLFATPFQVK
jgi:hypothetical protein